MQSPLLSKSHIAILGLARQFDFVIRLSSENAYKSILDGSVRDFSTYVHEWTHYSHFLASSLGNMIAEVERLIYFGEKQLVIGISELYRGHINPPLAEALPEFESAPEEIRQLATSLTALAEARTALSGSWSSHFNERVRLDTLRDRRPFSLDCDTGILTYAAESGDTWKLQITGMQILEHAATANELTILEGEMPLQDLSPEMMDYYGLYLFLYQERVINLHHSPSSNSCYFYVSGPWSSTTAKLVVHRVMYACCQIALVVYHSGKGHTSDIGGHDDEATYDSSFALNCAAYSAAVFATLISRFNTVTTILDDPSTSARAKIESICSWFGFCSYQSMLHAQLSRSLDARAGLEKPHDLSGGEAELERMIKGAIAKGYGRSEQTTDPKEKVERIDFHSLYTMLFYDRSILGLRGLIETPEASLEPVIHADAIPPPYVLIETESGARRLILPLGTQRDPKIVEIPRHVMSFFIEDQRLTEKILFERDLACYHSGASEEMATATRASFGCPHFLQCYADNKTTMTDFCSHEEWKHRARSYFNLVVALGEVGDLDRT